MPYFIIILLSLLLSGCSTRDVQIKEQVVIVQKSNDSVFLKEKEVPILFEYNNIIYAGIFWQNINDIQPSGKIIFEVIDNKYINSNKKIYPCNKEFFKGIDNDGFFTIHDDLCIGE